MSYTESSDSEVDNCLKQELYEGLAKFRTLKESYESDDSEEEEGEEDEQYDELENDGDENYYIGDTKLSTKQLSTDSEDSEQPETEFKEIFRTSDRERGSAINEKATDEKSTPHSSKKPKDNELAANRGVVIDKALFDSVSYDFEDGEILDENDKEIINILMHQIGNISGLENVTDGSDPKPEVNQDIIEAKEAEEAVKYRQTYEEAFNTFVQTEPRYEKVNYEMGERQMYNIEEDSENNKHLKNREGFEQKMQEPHMASYTQDVSIQNTQSHPAGGDGNQPISNLDARMIKLHEEIRRIRGELDTTFEGEKKIECQEETAVVSEGSLQEAPDNRRVHCGGDGDASQTLKGLEERSLQLQSEIRRLKAVLEETRRRNGLERDEVERDAKEILQQLEARKLEEEMNSVASSEEYQTQYIDMSNWRVQELARESVRAKRTAAALDFQTRLGEVEALCSAELCRLQEVKGALAPLNMMATGWGQFGDFAFTGYPQLPYQTLPWSSQDYYLQQQCQITNQISMNLSSSKEEVTIRNPQTNQIVNTAESESIYRPKSD